MTENVRKRVLRGKRCEEIQVGWLSSVAGRKAPGFVSMVDPQVQLESSQQQAWTLEESDTHLLTIAPTGAGKGRSTIIPTCLTWPGSLVVVDPKGEAANVTARQRKKLGNDVVVIDPFGITNSVADTFNPFDIMPYVDMSIEEFSLLFPSLLHPDGGGFHSDPFWDIRGDDLIAGIVAYMLCILKNEEQTIDKLRQIIKSGDVSRNLAVTLDTVGGKLCALANENLSSFLSTEEKCRSGILATAQQYFSTFADPKVGASLNSTSFDIGAFKDGKPMTIYLVLPVTRLTSHRALLRIWVSSLLSLIKGRRCKPANTTLLVIDEAAQLGRMNGLLDCMTLLRGFGVKTWTFWQSKKQLDRIYQQDADVILDNCGVVQAFGINNHHGAQALANLYGNAYGAGDILTLDRNQQIVLQQGGVVKIGRKLDYLNDSIYRNLWDVNPAHVEKAVSKSGRRR